MSALGAIPKQSSKDVRLIHVASRPPGSALSDYAINNASKKIYWPLQGGASFVEHFCYLCFVFVILSCLFIEH